MPKFVQLPFYYDKNYNKLLEEKQYFRKLALSSCLVTKPEKYKPTTPSWTFSQTPRFAYFHTIIF